MPHQQPALHGDELVRALTGIALEVQRARTVDEVLKVAGEGLVRLGVVLAVVTTEGTTYGIRYSSTAGARGIIGSELTSLKLPIDDSVLLKTMLESQAAVYEADLPGAVGRLLSHLDASLQARIRARLLEAGATTLVLAPLRIGGKRWGAMAALSSALSEDDVPAYSLFALQLGGALEMAQTMERLELRNAELDLVHALASAGPGADAAQLTQRALETVCRSTSSDAAALHRYDEDQGLFDQAGLFGDVGDDVSREWRSFPLPRDLVRGLAPAAMPASELPQGSREVAAAGFREVAVLPLSLEGRTSGMLTLVRRAERPYDAGDLHFAEILGVQALSLLARTALYEDLKKSYAQLEKAQSEVVRHERLAALGELAAVMAHEVRNPLGVIFNSLTTLKRLLTPTGDAKMLLEMVGEEAERLNRIVGDLLDFVRPYEVAKKPVLVEPVISSAVDAAMKTAAAPGVRVALDLPPELPPVPMDAHLLRQALENLVVNAVQAMPAGGVVTVRASLEERPGAPWLVVEVSDEGVGLPKKLTEDIFAPFVTTKATGTGLGLAVVKRIIDAHHGEVGARPNHGRGASFVVKLPTGLSARERLLTPPAPRPSAPRR